MNLVAVELRNVVKQFGHMAAVDNVSLDVRESEFLSLLGPSGCGKTTTLRIIAGFAEPDEGSVLIEGRDVVDRPPERRNIGMVFQNYALFPHMSVYDNIAYGLLRRRLNTREIDERVARVLNLVVLTGLEKRYPRQLSGGQQQRVALARAIVIQPRVLLLDEPLSNLDAKLRKSMQTELRDLQRELGMTTIHVTHDQEEALTLSDRLVILNQGRVMQIGSPREIYESPTSNFVADFIGRSNFFASKVESVDTVTAEADLVTDSGERLCLLSDRTLKPGAAVELFIRPEKIRLARPGSAGDARNVLEAEIIHVVYTGNLTTVEVSLRSGKRLVAERANTTDAMEAYSLGQRLDVVLPREALRILHSPESEV